MADQTVQRARNPETPTRCSSILGVAGAVIMLCGFLACVWDGPTSPSRGAVVTFRVVDETFRVQLREERQIDAAHQAADGGLARARLPFPMGPSR